MKRLDEGKRYWRVCTVSKPRVTYSFDHRDETDDACFECCNYFTTKDEATAYRDFVYALFSMRKVLEGFCDEA